MSESSQFRDENINIDLFSEKTDFLILKKALFKNSLDDLSDEYLFIQYLIMVRDHIIHPKLNKILEEKWRYSGGMRRYSEVQDEVQDEKRGFLKYAELLYTRLKLEHKIEEPLAERFIAELRRRISEIDK